MSGGASCRAGVRSHAHLIAERAAATYPGAALAAIAVESLAYLRSKRAVSHSSAYCSRVETDSYPDEFHTNGRRMPSSNSGCTASRMNGRYGVGDTRFQLLQWSLTASSRNISVSLAMEISSPFPFQLHGEFWQYRHFIVQREKNTQPLPPSPTRGGSSPK